MSTSPAKKAVMASRKSKFVEVTPVNKTHAVYLFVQKFPGLTEEEYKTGLIGGELGITKNDINTALSEFVRNGRMTEMQRGRGESRYSTYTVNAEVPYKPRPVMRKIQPNDKKALKAFEKKVAEHDEHPFAAFTPAIQESPILEAGSEAAKPAAEITNISTHRENKAKKQNFEMIEGLAAIDPNHPEFQETAKDLLSKVTPTELPAQESVKPMLELIFFNVGSQSVAATPQQFRQLYDELHALFGNK